jgi:hypothetical protein
MVLAQKITASSPLPVLEQSLLSQMLFALMQPSQALHQQMLLHSHLLASQQLLCGLR